jgi:hypothetical protein
MFGLSIESPASARSFDAVRATKSAIAESHVVELVKRFGLLRGRNP